MPSVIAFANNIVNAYSIEPVRTTYCIFRNESGNGQFGVNNNYAGLQADAGVWQGLTGVVATCVRGDNAGDTRRFICFAPENGYKISFEFTCKKVVHRGMYIGAAGVNTTDDLAQAYFKKWVANEHEVTPENIGNFKSLYNSSVKNIVQPGEPVSPPPSPTSATENVIKSIQTKLGIAATGTADDATWLAVYNNIIGPYAETADATTLVIAIQQTFNLPVTGFADDATFAAVMQNIT
jgi:hypothetical protein